MPTLRTELLPSGPTIGGPVLALKMRPPGLTRSRRTSLVRRVAPTTHHVGRARMRRWVRYFVEVVRHRSIHHPRF